MVTPSYNQAQFIEETIRSVLLQGYPDLEYIIMDGGSEDESIDIIRKYEPWLTHWESGRDGGQTYAIAAGAKRATGTIFNWVNSDDRLEPDALSTIGLSWNECDLLSGAARAVVSGAGAIVRSGKLTVLSLIDVQAGDGFHQPSVWLNLELFNAIGLNHDRQYGFDWELLVRYLLAWPRVKVLNEVLSQFVIHDMSKTGSSGHRFNEDRLKTALELRVEPIFNGYRSALARRIYRERRAVVCADARHIPMIKLLLAHPTACFDRFVLGSIRERLCRGLGAERTASVGGGQ